LEEIPLTLVTGTGPSGRSNLPQNFQRRNVAEGLTIRRVKKRS